MAQAFTRLGTSVTLVEMAAQLLVREDEHVIELISKKLRAEGVDIRTDHRAIAFENGSLICEHQGKHVTITSEHTLIALGRQANISGFGLEELGVNIRPQGTIDATPFLQTTIPNLYVCGDVTGPYQFTHVAAHQAWYASINALFAPFKRFKVDYRTIPWATFTDPEIAPCRPKRKRRKNNTHPL